MAGVITGSVEVAREVNLYVPQDAVDSALITTYGTPLPNLTMEEVQACLLSTGSAEFVTGGTAQEILHFTHFSGAFSGALEVDTPGNDDVYTNALWNHQSYQLDGTFGGTDTGFKGHFKYVKSGANYMSASIGSPKQISGSFPSNYKTSSGVTSQDINDISQSSFTGSFALTSGSMVSADFYTQQPNGTAIPILDSAYTSLVANCEVAFGLGDMSGTSVSRHLMVGGEFSNSSSLNQTSQGDNVGLVLNIVAGKVFTTSGSISHSLESLSDGEYIDRSPGDSNSGNYHAKCQGVDANGQPKKKKTIVGAKNRVELKTKRDSLADKVGTATGRPVTRFR
jgi:hypothetical protein